MKNCKSNYNKKNKPLARYLRKNSTPAEIKLWSEVLRAKKFHGYQFNRQFPLNNYIVDFICRKIKLIIEIDGYSHRDKNREDQLRQDKLESLGYTVLRFNETDVMNDIDNVIRVLEHHLQGCDQSP